MDTYKKIISLSVDTEEAKRELAKLRKTFDTFKNVKVEFVDVTKAKKQIDAAEQLAKKTEQIAASAKAAAFAFAGITPEQSKIKQLQKVVEAAKAAGKLSPTQADVAEKELNRRQDVLNKIGEKAEELQLTELVSPGDERKKEALQKELNELKAQLDGGSGMPKEKSPMLKAAQNVGKFALKEFTKIIKSIGKFFVDTFKNAFKNLSEMAMMDAGTTLFSNAAARQQQLTFGLTGAQNYAMTNAMQMLNMQSIEDLMWANPQQMAAYREISARLEAQYNQLEQSGIFKAVQEFQLDMSMMKMQFQNTIYQFIAEHKNEIVAVMKAAMEFMSWVLNLLGKIVGFFARMRGESYTGVDTAAVSSVINTSSTDNSIANNVTINYTNNEAQNGQAELISSSVLEKIVTSLKG